MLLRSDILTSDGKFYIFRFNPMAWDQWDCILLFFFLFRDTNIQEVLQARCLCLSHWIGHGLSLETGEAVWQHVLIFDYIPLPTLTYSSRAKDICSRLRCVFMALCVPVWERRCCFDPAAHQKKEACSPPLFSLAAVNKQQWNNPPADTAVRSSKRKRPPIYTFTRLGTVHYISAKKHRKRHNLDGIK